jgi:hypothetical protein
MFPPHSTPLPPLIPPPPISHHRQRHAFYGMRLPGSFQLIGNNATLGDYRQLCEHFQRPSQVPAGVVGDLRDGAVPVIKARGYARVGLAGNPSDGYYGKTIVRVTTNNDCHSINNDCHSINNDYYRTCDDHTLRPPQASQRPLLIDSSTMLHAPLRTSYIRDCPDRRPATQHAWSRERTHVCARA